MVENQQHGLPYNTLAITAMGRSGTRFLARTLGMDTRWKIQHEPHSAFQCVDDIQARFDCARAYCNYGEVNSFLRFAIIPLKVDVKRVILRDPCEIFASMYARGKRDLLHLTDALAALDAAISSGIPIISFRRMVSDPEYLREVAYACGIVLPVDLDMSAMNATPPEAKADVPCEVLRGVRYSIQWFFAKYGDYL